MCHITLGGGVDTGAYPGLVFKHHNGGKSMNLLSLYNQEMDKLNIGDTLGVCFHNASPFIIQVKKGTIVKVTPKSFNIQFRVSKDETGELREERVTRRLDTIEGAFGKYVIGMPAVVWPKWLAFLALKKQYLSIADLAATDLTCYVEAERHLQALRNLLV